MSELYWLTDEQMAKISPFFPKSHGKPRVDDRRVLSGIIFINRNGLRWRDAPEAYGPHKTLYSRWKRWSEKGIFARMMVCADDGRSGRRTRRGKDRDDRRDLPEGTPHRDQHGREKGGRGRLIGRTKGGMNTKLHVICDSQGRPLSLFVTAGQVSDYIGARALLSSLPKVDWLLGDRGYDADWFRDALKDKGIRACIPGRKQRKTTGQYDKRRYKRRNRIEIMFGRLKDWRRVATRYDRCPKVFLSAIALAAVVIYWL